MRLNLIEKIEGVHLLGSDESYPPPYVGIVGGLHGNETCGQRVIDDLRCSTHEWQDNLVRGTLVLIQGNPKAAAAGIRHTPGGCDLNRQFDYAFTEVLKPEAWCYEQHRAMALREILEELDALIDIHSSTAPTPPFAIVDERSIEQAVELGCAYVTYGWDDGNILDGKVLMAFMRRQGKDAYTIECGQHTSEQARARAWCCAERFLRMRGMLPGPRARSEKPPTLLKVLHRVGKPTEGFTFERPFEGFDRISAGESLGRGGGIRMVVQEDSVIILPNPNVGVGEDMLYLAQVVEGDILAKENRRPSGNAGEPAPADIIKTIAI